MKEYEVVIRDIPEHIVYYRDYWEKKHIFFLDPVTKENYLQTLSDKVMAENPKIQLTEPDYNYFLYLEGWFENGGVHIQFCDRVTGYGRDTGDYRFRSIDGVKAVTVLHEGSFERLEEAHSFAAEWIQAHGYNISGYPRDSFIHGFWDREDPEEYLTEVQIPVEKSGI